MTVSKNHHESIDDVNYWRNVLSAMATNGGKNCVVRFSIDETTDRPNISTKNTVTGLIKNFKIVTKNFVTYLSKWGEDELTAESFNHDYVKQKITSSLTKRNDRSK